MPSQEKPDVNTIWASAGEAEPVPKAKQEQGYVDEIPYYDDFNGHMQLISQFMKHITQEGVARWDTVTQYFTDAWVKGPDGKMYKARRDNKAKAPASNPLDWLLLSFERPLGLVKFTSSGTFTVPAGVTSLQVSGCAGGGGGGGGAGSSAPNATGGGGGGAGAFVLDEVINVTPGQVIQVVIGGGGIRGVGSTQNGSAGAAGGTTAFGEFISLVGGRGGGGANGSTGGGKGGRPGGEDGGDAPRTGSGGNGGSGGGGPFGTAGGGGRAGTNPTAADPGTVGAGYGTGGAGGGGNYFGTTGYAGAAGTNGMPGYLVIRWQ